MSLDLERLEGYLPELEDFQTRRLPYVRTDRLKTLLNVFDFKIRQSSSHINFSHPDPRFSDLTGVIVQKSEKKDSYLDVSRVCLEVYRRLEAELAQQAEPLADVFEAGSRDEGVEADFKRWGEEIALGNGRVILRSEDFPSIGVEISDTPDARAREIPKLKSRAKDFRSMVYETCKRFGFNIEAREDNTHVFNNWVHSFAVSAPPFDADHQADAGDVLVAMHAELERHTAVFKSAIDWISKESGFFDPPQVKPVSRGQEEIHFRFSTGFYSGSLSVVEYQATTYSPSRFTNLCEMLHTFYEPCLDPKNLRLMGFEVSRPSANSYHAQHRFYPDIQFDFDRVQTSFPSAAFDYSLDSESDLGHKQAIVDETMVHIRNLHAAFAELRPAFQALHEAHSKRLEKVKATYPNWAFVPDRENPSFGTSVSGFLCDSYFPNNGTARRIRALVIPDDFQFKKASGPSYIFHPEDIDGWNTKLAAGFAAKAPFAAPVQRDPFGGALSSFGGRLKGGALPLPGLGGPKLPGKD